LDERRSSLVDQRFIVGHLVLSIDLHINLKSDTMLTHHRWYKEKFPDYPTDRKAVVPFLL